MKHLTDWKNWFLTLPETAFSGLCRNYLGEIKTPFNKHHLFEELKSFLSREQVQQKLADLLDELDHQILTIILLSGRAPEAPVVPMTIRSASRSSHALRIDS